MNPEDEIAQLKKHIETLEQRFHWSLLDHRRVLEDWNAQRIVLDAAVLQAAYTFQTINENAQVPDDMRTLAAKGCERCDKAHEDAGYQPRPALSTDAAAKVVIRVEDSILERLASKNARKTRIAEMQKGSAGRPQGRPGHPGTRIILRAMAYLEKTYGSEEEEKEAIELLGERATDPPRPE